MAGALCRQVHGWEKHFASCHWEASQRLIKWSMKIPLCFMKTTGVMGTYLFSVSAHCSFFSHLWAENIFTLRKMWIFVSYAVNVCHQGVQTQSKHVGHSSKSMSPTWTRCEICVKIYFAHPWNFKLYGFLLKLQNFACENSPINSKCDPNLLRHDKYKDIRKKLYTFFRIKCMTMWFFSII